MRENGFHGLATIKIDDLFGCGKREEPTANVEDKISPHFQHVADSQHVFHCLELQPKYMNTARKVKKFLQASERVLSH